MKKALIVAQICASHQMAAEFNDELQTMADRRKLVVDWLAREAEQLAQTMSKEYHYTVVSAVNEPFIGAAIKQGDPVRVVRRWTNRVQWTELRKVFGVDFTNGAKDIDVSCVLYRVAGVLVALGSGKAFLEPNKHVSDDDWRDIKSNRVERFLNKAA